MPVSSRVFNAELQHYSDAAHGQKQKQNDAAQNHSKGCQQDFITGFHTSGLLL